MFPEAAEARRGRPFSAACASLLLCGSVLGPEVAQAKEALSFDLSAGATVSSNPFLDVNGGKAAVGAQAGAEARYRYDSERTSLAVGAGAQSSTYFDGRGTDLTGNVTADLQHRISERTAIQVLGHYRYSRSSGYDYVLASAATLPLQGGISGSPSSTPPIITPQPVAGGGLGLPPDTTVIGRRIAEHSYGGAINLELKTSERSKLALAADANEVRYNSPLLSNYRMFSQAAAFSHQVSQATNVTARMTVAEVKYDSGENDTILTPMVGLTRKLNSTFDLAVYGGASVLRSRLPNGLRINSSSLAVSAQLCGHYERRDFCISGERAQLPSAQGGVRPSTIVRAAYNDRLNRDDTLNLALAFDRRGRDTRNFFRSQTSVGGTARYDHRFGDRLSVFASAGYTRLWESSVPSRSEVRGTVGIALRLGDRG